MANTSDIPRKPLAIDDAEQVAAAIDDGSIDPDFLQALTEQTDLIDGRYVIDEKIGQGLTSIVYAGYDLHLERAVAIKIVWPEFRGSLLEAASAARVGHDNIANILDVSEDGGYIVMELLSEYDDAGARSLARSAITTKPQDLREALRWTRDAARGLAAMHRGNVCHGDVKPHNALVMPKSRRLKLIDFGMASSLGRARLTGTPEYMAPEVGEQFLRWRGQAETQAESAELDPVAVDMYGLGCLAYDLITNQRPRPTSRSRKEPVTIMEVRDLELHRLKEAMSATPSFDGKLRTQWGRRLPRRVRQLLAATLDRRPEARGTPSALADEIDCYLAHEPLAGERHKIWLRVALWCRRYPSLALLVVGLVGVVILGVFAEHLASNASNADAALSETKRQLVVEQQQVAEEKQRVVSVQQELAKTASKVDAMIDELKKSQIASAERQSVITDLERVRNTLRSEVARKTKTIADKDHEIAKRDGDLSEKELQIQKLNVEYKTAMTRLDAAHAAAIGKLDAAHALAIGKLDAVHALAITRLKSEHEVEIQKLEKKLADSLAVQPGPGVAGAVSGGSNATGSGAAGSGALGETGSGATGSGAAGSGTLGGTASGAAGSGAEGSSDRGSASILPSSGGG